MRKDGFLPFTASLGGALKAASGQLQMLKTKTHGEGKKKKNFSACSSRCAFHGDAAVKTSIKTSGQTEAHYVTPPTRQAL